MQVISRACFLSLVFYGIPWSFFYGILVYALPVQEWNLQVCLGALRRFVTSLVTTLAAPWKAEKKSVCALYRLNLGVSENRLNP